MRTKNLVLGIVLALFVPSLAFANSVTVKNKDGKKVVLTVKRSNTTMEETVLPRMTLVLPGAPMKLTHKTTGEVIEAVSGETVVIEKGKLTKLEPEPEEGEAAELPPSEPPAESAPAEEPKADASPVPAPTE